jgi:hypothetical protein
VDDVSSIPQTKTTEELGISMTKVTDKMFGQADTKQNVLRML